MAVTGTVLALNRYPVKSMAGQPAQTVRLFGHGIVGDREHALSWPGGRRLTARAAPRMLAWSASSGGDGCARVVAPDGREFAWSDPGLAAAISEDLGKDVDLVRDPSLMQDLPDSVLVTFASTHAGLERELATAIDVRRFRPNVHVELDGDVEAFAELGWEGRTLRVGEAELDLLHPCARCAIVTRDPDTQEAWPQLLRHLHRMHDSVYGINARPRGEATIAVGDRVELG